MILVITSECQLILDCFRCGLLEHCIGLLGFVMTQILGCERRKLSKSIEQKCSLVMKTTMLLLMMMTTTTMLLTM